MNISFYRAFVDVAKYKSITRAAELANISQPALSQQIKAMEAHLDCTLFERTHKGVALTDEGEVVLKYATRLISCHDKMIKEVENLKHDKNHRINIMATPIVYAYALPCTIHSIKENFESYDLEMKAASSIEIENQIVEGKADIGFIIGTPLDESLYCRPLIQDPYYLVASTDLDVPDTLTVEELYDYQVLMLKKSQKCRQLLSQQLEKCDVDESRLRIPYELDTTESIKTSTVRGFGLAFLPYMSIKKEVYNKQLKIIKLEGFEFMSEYHLIRKNITDDSMEEHLEIMRYIEDQVDATKC